MKDKDAIPIYELSTLSRSVGLIPLHEDVMTLPFTEYPRIPDKMNIPHRHNYYHVRLFTKGSGMQTIDFEQFRIRASQIYFMIPGQIHSWDNEGDMDGYAVNFSENIFRSVSANPGYLEQFTFLRGIPGDSVIDLNKQALEEAIHFFNQIITEVNNKDSFSMEMVCIALMSLFVSINRNLTLPVSKRLPTQKQKTLSNFRQLVNNHFSETKLPKAYAAMLYITPDKLNALCIDCLGMSAGKFIRNRIVVEAKRLLVNTDMNISEIADKLGFTDSSYFTKFFKKYTSATPEEFKKLHADISTEFSKKIVKTSSDGPFIDNHN